MRRVFVSLIAVAVVAVLAVLTFAWLPTTTRVISSGAATGQYTALVEKGRYLATAGDCVACHTGVGRQPFGGGLALVSPVGIIYSSNITPDRDTGIGNYSLNDFDRVLRHGILPSGKTLYPAMPYPSYARLRDEDVLALYVYFMHGVAPVHVANHSPEIRWPLSMRWPLAIWRKLFAPDPDQLASAAIRYSDPVVERGAYLVQGLGHCGSCHTPRALTLQEKALNESGADYLVGGQVIDGWSAVNLRGNGADGLGGWAKQDVANLLRNGHSDSHAVIGTAMSDVVMHSTQYLHDDDLDAMAAYLKSLPPARTEASTFAVNPATARVLREGINDTRGAELYVDNCAACHRTDGEGYLRVFPEIAGNSTVLSADATSLIRLILVGSASPVTAGAPSQLGMPGFASRLSDTEVAKLVTFLRQSWGNNAAAVTVGSVKAIRNSIPQELNATISGPRADAGRAASSR
jgi:alcohol dehydrogenase (quinone), cytochrome c subunit